MNKQVLLIASKLLEQASENFSNNGCNDLNEEVLSVIANEDEDELTEDFRKWFNDGDYPQSINQVADYLLMDYISFKLKEEGLKD